jgi:hypothetical protein
MKKINIIGLRKADVVGLVASAHNVTDMAATAAIMAKTLKVRGDDPTLDILADKGLVLRFPKLNDFFKRFDDSDDAFVAFNDAIRDRDTWIDSLSIDDLNTIFKAVPDWFTDWATPGKKMVLKFMDRSIRFRFGKSRLVIGPC